MKNLFYRIFGSKIFIGILRYFLGINMLIYGITKLMQTQFIILPFSTWMRPLEDLSGINLTWAFLGYNPWFTVLLGVIEFVPGILLMFRRTYYLGSILLLPVMLNVTLINFALDLWKDTQVISSYLLAINIILLISGWKSILVPVISKIWNFQSVQRFFKWEILANVLVIGGIVIFFGKILIDYRNQSDFLTGDWFHKKVNVWTIEETSSETPDSTTLSLIKFPVSHQVFFEPYGAVEVRNTTTGQISKYSYKLSEENKTLFIDIEDLSVFECTYDYQDDSLLILTPIGKDGFKSQIKLRRRIIHRSYW